VLAIVVGGILLLAQVNSKNAGTVVVPDVKGVDLVQARQTLADAGFAVKTKTVANTTVPVNRVISETPSAGSRAKKGSTILLVVSRGSGQITIQDVAGTTVADATRILEDQGLKVGGVKRTQSDTAPVNTVIHTDPSSGTAVGKGFPVVLIVSSGPKLVPVPNVLGLDATTAANQLGQQFFVVNRQDAFSDTVPKGNVISTKPAPNTPAPKGSTVTVVVSSGPEMIAVKDVTGESESQAKSDLEAQGFVVFVAHASSGADNAGKVISQDPVGGSQRTKGSTVVITVGQAPPTSTSTPPTT
jgi:beta-lactam-binding protein with PASTA domain